MDADYWKDFLRKDGKILVELDKIMYGYKEAAHWRNKTLIKVFMDYGYHQMSNDQCVMVKTDGNRVSYCAITVDDCFFAITRDENWINAAITMLKGAFEELTVERGETINILGMTVHMDRKKKRAIINQKHFLDLWNYKNRNHTGYWRSNVRAGGQ